MSAKYSTNHLSSRTTAYIILLFEALIREKGHWVHYNQSIKYLLKITANKLSKKEMSVDFSGLWIAGHREHHLEVSVEWPLSED